ncbi:3-succinoylsemialdehyde-pyridine dehydrogenase [Venturia inaequalis]|nr:3-succinoylsemialdehyde-pyridine dehydrogenase [Venturia inaequalis]
MNLATLLTLAFATTTLALPSVQIGRSPQYCDNGCPIARLGGCPKNCN